MASNSEFHIFRDSRRQAPATGLIAAMRKQSSHLSAQAEPDQLTSLLLQAGELECGLFDAGAPRADCEQSALLTDLFADAAVANDKVAGSISGRQLAAAALPILDRICFAQSVSISVPEGFAYYALHPLDYADLIAGVKHEIPAALVVGVRSIGTTLSAVVAAKLGEFGVIAARITVRPTGHPYDRVCEFDSAQQRVIAASLTAKLEFLICDEGPGRSGSSLLSVAEALERSGVPASRIRILCSHEPDIHALCATDAARRWSRYRSAYVGLTKRLPEDAARAVDSDERRRMSTPESHEWPAVWPQFERLTYASANPGILLTFEGHGHYGAAVRARNKALSSSGFGLPYLGQEVGFGRHLASQGRTARQSDLTPQLLTRMAEYCAWRAREFGVSDAPPDDLETMVRVNFEREFGSAPQDFALPVIRPAICDAHMLPSSWVEAQNGRWLKMDGATRGDDHFFPGPCDIAWDLAGIAVEWGLTPAARDSLLTQYRQASGDDPANRMRAYELAYATFRMAWSRMAAASVRDPNEEARLFRDYRRYREFLRKLQAADLARSQMVESQVQSA